MNCCYCDRIAAAERTYEGRPAEFDLGSEGPRCAWHWRFVCDHCGEPGHFMARFYCSDRGAMLCRDAGAVAVVDDPFWGWEYRLVLRCPLCGEEHGALDYAEFRGTHPWQADPEAGLAHRWLSQEPHLVRYPRPLFPRVEESALTDADIDETWSANADVWLAGYDERGDHNRKYQSDPVLFRFLGEVRGQRVLDAGSGGGYLARLLARRGAEVIGVENARALHARAIAEEAREPLGIAFHHASVSAMPFLEDASLDAVVANYVLMDVRDYVVAVREVARVLRPGGRFVCVLSHNTVDAQWHVPIPDSPRREDRAGLIDDDYFIRRAGYVQWGSLKPFISFHRPLRDYVAACHGVGLTLRDLDEPELSEEALRDWPPAVVRHHRRTAWSYVLKFVKP